MSAPSDGVEAEATSIPRRLWIVIPLVLLGGPFAFVYRGQLGRAIIWQLGIWVVLPVLAAAMLYTPATRFALCALVAIAAAIPIAVAFFSSRRQTQPWRPYQRWWAYLAIYAVFVVCQMAVVDAFRAFWCEAYVVPTDSMATTILAGDRILVEKLAFSGKDLRPGPVLVFRAPPHRNVSDGVVAKRLIAMEGDTVRLEEDQLFVNGHPLNEPYAQFTGNPPPPSYASMRDLPSQQVPEGHVFVIGDNRWQSLDSRSFGFVPVSSLIGEAKIIFWSREYKLIPPTRENPQGDEMWGSVRWDRIGTRVR